MNIISPLSFVVLKTRQQAPNGVTYCKPHVSKLRLHYSFGSSRNGILTQSIRNGLTRTGVVTCLIDPCRPLKESNLAVTNPLFC